LNLLSLLNSKSLVATQDGNLRDTGKWLITKYDAINRPVATAEYNTNSSPSAMQTLADSCTAETSLYEIRDNNRTHGYTERTFPGDVDDSDYLTVTYYDDYSYRNQPTVPFDNVYKIDPYRVSEPVKYNERVKGFVTGMKVKVLRDGVNQWLLSATYYDDRYRVIQTRSDLYDGSSTGKETTSTLFDFTGKVLRTVVVQVFGGVTTTIATGNTYDHAGRLLATTQQVTHSGISTETVTVTQNQYNALGQLKEKNLANGRQSVDYTYNVRGWLMGINNPDSLDADLFGMRLSYGEATATGALPQYNGNIAEAVWNTRYGNLKRSAYGYSYDALNRLTNSDYWTMPASTLANSTAYEERGLTYDRNGNIKTLIRTNNNGDVLNNLTYTYEGNQLKNLNVGTAYTYDRNGNMTTDGMRGFSVEYNLLNLPKKVSKGTENISYIYSATGTKLAMLKGTTVVNFYAGMCVYKGNKTLDYALHPEGVVRATGQGLSYEYFLNDHLGNTRVVFGSDGAVLQTTDYYAFGMSHTPKAKENENRYLYNGKEQQDALIGGVKFDWYDYGARFYDPALGRFTTLDPFTEWHFNYNPYHYCFNNPINFIDPFGLDTIPTNQVDWPNFSTEEDVVALDEVIVFGKRPSWLVRTLRKIGRALQSADYALEGEGGTQEGGIPLVTGGETYSPTKQVAEHPDQELNIDELLPVLGGQRGSTKVTPNPLNVAKAINKAGKAAKEIQNMTSDKQITEQFTGTAVKTDANGRPIQETTQSQGQESDSVEVQIGVYFTDDSVLVQDYKRHVKTNLGRNVSKPYWKKWSNPFK